MTVRNVSKKRMTQGENLITLKTMGLKIAMERAENSATICMQGAAEAYARDTKIYRTASDSGVVFEYFPDNVL